MADYRLLFEHSPLPAWVFDEHTLIFLAVNRAAIELYGYSEEEFLSMRVLDIRPEHEVPALLALIQKWKADTEAGADHPREFGLWWHRKKDGSVVAVEIRGVSISFDGRPAKLIQARDVSQSLFAWNPVVEAQEEQRLKLAIEGTGTAVWDWNLATGEVYRTSRWVEILGYAPGEVAPNLEAWLDLLHPEDATAAKAALESHLRGETPVYDSEHRLRMKSGEWKWVLDRGKVMARDAQGHPVRVTGIQKDISLRMQNIEKQRYQASLIEAVSDAIVALDTDFRIVSWNRGAERIYGWTAGEVTGKRLDDVVGTRILGSSTNEALTELLERGFWEGEAVQRRKDGSEVLVMAYVSLIRDPQGAVTGYVGANRDITERKRAQNALHESERRFRMLADNAPVVIWMCDAELNLTYVNKLWCELTGFPGETRDCTEFLHPDDRRRVTDLFASAAAARDTFEAEYRIRGVAGERWILNRGIPRLLPDGTFAGYIGSCTDITAHKRLEEQTRTAQKLDAIGRLAGGIAHDFNNLLTVITGYTGIVKESLGSENTLQSELNAIERAADRAASVTRRMLAFSGRQPLQPKEIDLSDSISALRSALEEIAGPRILLKVDLEAGLRRIKADPAQIKEVLEILVTNACEAMPAGGQVTIRTREVEIAAGAAAETAPGSYVELTVGDTGSGMDRETLARIFEPFFTTKATHKAAGLGLATVYGFMTQSLGSISADSEPGKGTQFRMLFPAVQYAESPVPAPAPDAGPATILVLDDDESIRGLVLAILRSRSYHVLEAARPADALAICDSYRGTIDLVVTDVVMPEMNGVEAARRIVEKRPEARIIWMSGFADRAMIGLEEVPPRGRYLQKPFTAESLLDAVRQSTLD